MRLDTLRALQVAAFREFAGCLMFPLPGCASTTAGGSTLAPRSRDQVAIASASSVPAAASAKAGEGFDPTVRVSTNKRTRGIQCSPSWDP
jgi:hypothetical protein